MAYASCPLYRVTGAAPPQLMPTLTVVAQLYVRAHIKYSTLYIFLIFLLNTSQTYRVNPTLLLHNRIHNAAMLFYCNLWRARNGVGCSDEQRFDVLQQQWWLRSFGSVSRSDAMIFLRFFYSYLYLFSRNLYPCTLLRGGPRLQLPVMSGTSVSDIIIMMFGATTRVKRRYVI